MKGNQPMTPTPTKTAFELPEHTNNMSTLCEIFMKEKRVVKRHYPGCYRVTLANGFAQIKKQKTGWLVELRDNTGALIRFAGTHSTLKSAVDEVIR